MGISYFSLNARALMNLHGECIYYVYRLPDYHVFTKLFFHKNLIFIIFNYTKKDPIFEFLGFVVLKKFPVEM